MFRTTTALATLALVAASAHTAHADVDADDLTSESQANVTAMHQSIKTQIGKGVYGWEVAIAQNGHLRKADADGTALSAVDNGGLTSNPLKMAPTMRMELASATKTITAMATLKLLRRNNLDVDDSIDPYLPPGWVRGPGFKTKSITFRHLLTHTSGLKQAIVAMPDATRPTDNGWKDMQVVVKNGTTIPASPAYKNANFALLRILNAELWKRSGGGVKQIVGYTPPKPGSMGGLSTSGDSYETVIPVDEQSSEWYALDAMRKLLFEPAGLKGISCTPDNAKTAVKSYVTGTSKVKAVGYLHIAPKTECAGARGIRLSAVEHVQLLAHLRHGDILDQDDVDLMDENRFGWSEDSDGGDGGESGTNDGKPDNSRSPGVFWHGGDLLGDRQLHTCGMTFDDGTEASLMFNATLATASPCTVLIKAWEAAS